MREGISARPGVTGGVTGSGGTSNKDGPRLLSETLRGPRIFYLVWNHQKPTTIHIDSGHGQSTMVECAEEKAHWRSVLQAFDGYMQYQVRPSDQIWYLLAYEMLELERYAGE